MKYKVVFWNPIKSTKRVYHFVAMWDYSNHRWNMNVSNTLFTSERPIYTTPTQFISEWAKNMAYTDEYINIKEVA